MIAVVESGSTKSDWRIIDADGQVTETSTAGFNPYHVGRDRIVEELSRNEVLRGLASSVATVHFYGAGCSSSAMNSIVQGAIQEVFAHAEVHVDHDLLGAALAAGQGSACIVGILGTGSNACFFDGADVDNGRPALGYVLGDEAGGSWFGKRIIADHLHGLLPEPMHAALENLGVTRESVLQRVYMEPRPNTYLAGFMPVLSEFRQTAYAQTLLRDGFTAFLTRYVCHFPQHSAVEVHLVGSVAHHFADELRASATQLGVRIGRIVHRPIDALVAYHTAR
jgi:glucosamine kinase